MNLLKNLEIKRKLTLIVLLSTALALVLACGVFLGFELLTFEDRAADRLNSLADVVGANTSAAIDFDDRAAAADTLSTLSTDESILAARLFDKDDKPFAEFRRDPAALLPETPMLVASVTLERAEVFRPVYGKERQRIGTVFLRSDTAEINDRLKTYVGIALGVLAIALLLAFIFANWLQRLVSVPIGDLVNTARRVSETKTYSLRAKKYSNDELGTLAEGFNEMLAQIEARDLRLEEMVTARTAELAEKTDELAVANQDLQSRNEELSRADVTRQQVVDTIADTARDIGAVSAQILSAATDQAGGAQDQAAAISETVTTVREVTQTAEQAAERAATVAEAAKRSDEIGKAGEGAVEDTILVMNEVTDQVESIATRMVVLAEQAQAIGEIIGTVNEIAEQTNLLALNASIEASRAGEHGRGFSVVAAEIKALAAQSKKATQQVRLILGEIQKATNSAVMATEEGTKKVREAMDVTGQAGDIIQQLVETLTDAAQSASQIVASAQQQSIGISQIHLSMTDISDVSTKNLVASEQNEQGARNLIALTDQLNDLVVNYTQTGMDPLA